MKRRISSGWELERLQRHIDELFDLIASPPAAEQAAWSPAVDVLDLPGHFLVRVDLPGVAASDIEVHLHERELHISGTKSTQDPAVEPRRCHLMERGFGPFAVEVLFPAPVRADRSHAKLAAGVLEVRLQRLDDRRSDAHALVIAIEEP